MPELVAVFKSTFSLRLLVFQKLPTSVRMMSALEVPMPAGDLDGVPSLRVVVELGSASKSGFSLLT